MKPSKTKAAKRPSSLSVRKLLDLKYRINDAYRNGNGSDKDDKLWVMGQISALREGARLDKHQMKYANGLWNKYNPSRLNNWDDSHSTVHIARRNSG